MAVRTSRSDFEAVFPSLVQDLTEYVQQYNAPDQALKWFQQVLQSLWKAFSRINSDLWLSLSAPTLQAANSIVVSASQTPALSYSSAP